MSSMLALRRSLRSVVQAIAVERSRSTNPSPHFGGAYQHTPIPNIAYLLIAILCRHRFGGAARLGGKPGCCGQVCLPVRLRLKPLDLTAVNRLGFGVRRGSCWSSHWSLGYCCGDGVGRGLGHIATGCAVEFGDGRTVNIGCDHPVVDWPGFFYRELDVQRQCDGRRFRGHNLLRLRVLPGLPGGSTWRQRTRRTTLWRWRIRLRSVVRRHPTPTISRGRFRA
jgi:hypothetical protein